MKEYDKDMIQYTNDNEKTEAEYEDTMADLNMMQQEHNMLMEERRKREEIQAIMQKKKDEQNAKMDKLIRASEYIQAHWRGM